MALDIHHLFDISGLCGVIAGGAGDLCGAISQGLAPLGARLALLDINGEKVEERAKQLRGLGGEARGYACSVLDEEELLRVAERIRSDFGDVDFLLNGAGGNNPKGSTSKEFFYAEDLEDPEVQTFSICPQRASGRPSI